MEEVKLKELIINKFQSEQQFRDTYNSGLIGDDEISMIPEIPIGDDIQFYLKAGGVMDTVVPTGAQINIPTSISPTNSVLWTFSNTLTDTLYIKSSDFLSFEFLYPGLLANTNYTFGFRLFVDNVKIFDIQRPTVLTDVSGLYGDSTQQFSQTHELITAPSGSILKFEIYGSTDVTEHTINMIANSVSGVISKNKIINGLRGGSVLTGSRGYLESQENFNISIYSSESSNINLFSTLNTVIGGIDLVSSGSGNTTDYNNRMRSLNYIPFSDTAITISTPASYLLNNYNIAIAYFDESKKFINSSYNTSGWEGVFPVTRAVPANTKYIGYVIRRKDNVSITAEDFLKVKFKIEPGSKSTQYINGFYQNISIGGRNLVLNSDIPTTTNTYLARTIDLSEDLVTGQEYTISVYGTVGVLDNKIICVSRNTTGTSLGYVSEKSPFGYRAVTFIWNPNPTDVANKLSLYSYPNNGDFQTTITKIKLEKGNKVTDWTAAPEDVKAYTDNAVAQNTVVLESEINQRFAETSAQGQAVYYNRYIGTTYSISDQRPTTNENAPFALNGTSPTTRLFSGVLSIPGFFSPKASYTKSYLLTNLREDTTYNLRVVYNIKGIQIYDETRSIITANNQTSAIVMFNIPSEGTYQSRVDYTTGDSYSENISVSKTTSSGDRTVYISSIPSSGVYSYTQRYGGLIYSNEVFDATDSKTLDVIVQEFEDSKTVELTNYGLVGTVVTIDSLNPNTLYNYTTPVTSLNITASTLGSFGVAHVKFTAGATININYGASGVVTENPDTTATPLKKHEISVYGNGAILFVTQ